MELLQLRYFYESAKNQNFARTAEKYMVPASSVSASIRRLEKELGVALFYRTHNRIELSEKGAVLQQALQTVFESLDGAVEKLTSATADTRTIHILVRAMRSRITNHIIEYKTKNPAVSFKTFFDFGETDFEKYDIIISEQADLFPTYESFRLYEATLKLRASADHPLCNKKLSLKQLSNQPFLSYGEKNSLDEILEEACKKQGFSPKIVLQSNDILCLRNALNAGMGIQVCRALRDTPPPAHTAYLNVTDFNFAQTIRCYYKEDSAYGNVKHFIQFLKNASR